MSGKRLWAARSESEDTGANVLEEEEDYMSDKFLASLEAAAGSSSGKRGNKRKRQLRARPPQPAPQQQQLPLRQRMAQTLQQGMDQQIQEDNPGFRLLKKFGYQEGTGLGRNKAGIVNPIGIDIKQGRAGLGKDAQVKAEQEQRKELQRMQREMQEMRQRDFRGEGSARYLEQRMASDLTKARHSAQTLDAQAGKAWPGFWADPSGKAGDGGAGASEDLAGSALDEHVQEPIYRPASPAGTSEGEEDAPAAGTSSASRGAALGDGALRKQMFEMQPTAEKLNSLLQYLRNEHHFCLYCGCSFSSAADIAKNCPGQMYDDH
uniref:G-patch domain-containing protein n=1 Tax=Fibrocapsa japonica TaxID=94617 RepID=A0A7S2Y0F0_9STRA|mmetsp:Transcript_5013/g.7607  ORF Transcript_5013/g.7607 Transcript_5013/m.7607 type:complete len:320 (+) Transcript_5013:65-1024(+)